MRDPYLYLDVDVLINKKNIKDQNKLDKLEEDIIPLRMIVWVLISTLVSSSNSNVRELSKFANDIMSCFEASRAPKQQKNRKTKPLFCYNKFVKE